MRHPVSSLALGPCGWVQRANFWLNGILYLAFAAVLVRAQDRRCTSFGGIFLVAAAGAGQIGAGIYTTDLVSDYPPGTAHVLGGYSSTEALLHDVPTIPVFLGIPTRSPDLGTHLRAPSAPLLGAVLRCHRRNHGRRLRPHQRRLRSSAGTRPAGGLIQRLTVSTGMAWLSALAIHFLLAPDPSTGS